MSRTFTAKRGHYIDSESVEEAMDEVFGNFTREGDAYVVEDFEAFRRVTVAILDHDGRKDELRVDTEADIDRVDRAVQAKRALNDFLEKVTGYTPEGRKEAMKREVEK